MELLVFSYKFSDRIVRPGEAAAPETLRRELRWSQIEVTRFGALFNS